jgi:hypothetical protein
MDIKKQDLEKISYEPPARELKPAPSPKDVPPPIKPDPLPEKPDWPEVPFAPPDPEAAYQALSELYAERPFSTRLHSQTGLPAYLVGELQDLQDRSPIDAAEAYLKENELALVGHEDGAWIEHTYEAEWDDDTSQVTFDQTNEDGVPLYGSSVACSYRGGRLIVISSTLHPVLPDEINNLEWDEPTWLDDKGIATLNLPDEIQPIRFEAPRDLRGLKSRLADRWILPYDGSPDVDRPPEAGTGTYRPVWRVVIVDRYERRWLVLVDAEDAARPEVLYWEPTWVEASVAADAYKTAQDALPPEKLTPVTLDYGNGADMAHADHVHAFGDNFVEPADPNGETEKLRRLSATAFFHVRRIQEHEFPTLLAGLLSLSSVTGNAIPDPKQDIKVKLRKGSGSAVYDEATGTIDLPDGQSGQWPINRPGYDCEVIYHEFIHALDRYVNPPMFKFNNWKERSCTRAIDEGFAFYFACVLGGDAHWAEYAYEKWIDSNGDPYRHLTKGPTTPAQVLLSGDPDNQTVAKVHAIGTWWARLFWALRDPGQLGPDRCNELLLQTVRALTPIEEPSDFAKTLEGMAQNDVDKAKIRAMAAQFKVSTLHYKTGGTPFIQD